MRSTGEVMWAIRLSLGPVHSSSYLKEGSWGWEWGL
jgi:hypothetical protein